jgi:hypothetical protein
VSNAWFLGSVISLKISLTTSILITSFIAGTR